MAKKGKGKVIQMLSPLHSAAKARQVIAQLERAAGKGNYYLINDEGDILNEDNE